VRVSRSPRMLLVVSLGGVAGLACQQQVAPQSAAPLAVTPPAASATAEAPADGVVAEAELANPSTFARSQSPIYFSYYDLGLPDGDPRSTTLTAKAGDTAVLSQAIDSDGDGRKDGLLTLLDFAAGETKQLTISAGGQAEAQATSPKRTQAEISHKVGGQWQPRKDKPELKEYVGGTFQSVRELTPPPEHTDHSGFIRYEGPGIESDKVGYRVYLDWRNGFDIFGKKVSAPALHKIGLDGFESYHHMSDWGMDILKVGQSLGAGGFGFWNGKKVELVSKVGGWTTTITENGSLYSSLRIVYRGWQVNDKKVDLTADLSMTAGSRAVRVKLRTSEPLPNLAIGLVKHPGTEVLAGPTEITGTAFTYAGSYGKQSLNNDLLGMAVLFPQGSREAQTDDGASYVSVMKPANTELEYYFLAAWQGEPGGIQSKAEFATYLDREIEQLTITPRRRLKTALSQKAASAAIDAQTALDWAKRLADSELARKTLSYRHGGWDVNRKRKPKFEYDIVGLQPLAYSELNEVAPDPKYDAVLAQVTGSYVTPTGELLEYKESEYNIDSIAPGRNLLKLYAKTKDEKYRKAADQLRQQMRKQPRTSQGAFWHKQRYPFQLWLDGVYMGMPFLTGYSAAFEQGKSFDEVIKEFVITRQQLRDPKTGLYVHAWDEKKQQTWADPKTGLSKLAWGRGLGWYSMAAVDVLDILPEADVERRKPLLEIVRELADALVKVQDPATGVWWQILDQPTSVGNYRESSASAMFAYFFAKAVRKGYLPKSYQATAQKAFAGLIQEFITVHADGKISMTNQCLVAGLGYGRDGSYRYYMSEPIAENDPKGNGPFIMAGVELHRLLKGPS
jgi:unsaturated rhamnogalacturonyl hydrolase